MAKKGNVPALRLCIERLMPPRKDRPVQVPMPPLYNACFISQAMCSVAQAVSEGEITPQEGEALARILSVQTEVSAKVELELRMKRIEERIAQDEKYKVPESDPAAQA